ncbi:MAG: amidohydrolase family protein [Rubrivivax sp.]|nr:amidohydrolase family protein [Rubrivivax sp.]
MLFHNGTIFDGNALLPAEWALLVDGDRIAALRDCGGVGHVEIAVRDACNSGRLLGPTLRVAGRCICVTGGTNAAVARVADGPTDIVKAVREQAHAGCDCIKLMATGGVLSPGTDVDDAQYTQAELEAGVAEARRFGKPVATHAIGAAGILNAARAGVDSIEHGVFLTAERSHHRGVFKDGVGVPQRLPLALMRG